MDDGFWEDMEERNSGEFWRVEPDEADAPSAVENLIETVVLHPVSEPAEKRPTPHRHRRRRGVRSWLPVLIPAVLGLALAGTAAWAATHATPLGGKPKPDVIRVTLVTPVPTPVPVPAQTRWRTREVKVPGPVRLVTPPTVTVTKTVTPAPKISIRPRVTITVTEPEMTDDPFNPNP